MGINVRNYSLLCNKGSAKFNEDVVGISPYGTWVLDGATGLNKKNLVSKSSDARWYTQWWNKYLYENISKDESLKSMIRRGINEIKDEYLDRTKDVHVEKIDFPSSSIALIKFHDEKIEYLLLGDCTLFLKGDTNNVIKDRTVSKLDESVFEKMRDLSNMNRMSFEEVKEEVMDIIIENRLKKNNDKGYWILEFDDKAVENSINGFISIEKDIQIVIATDGFTCCCDRYNIVSEKELINECEKHSIEYLYKKIRDCEENDFKGIKFPRFKVNDDTSCVYLDIYRD